MTLILAAGNPDQVVQVSDRLLTKAGRSLVLPKNKAVRVSLADGRLLCGFAGLARAGSFHTGDWMLDALAAAARPDYRSESTVHRFVDAATQVFRSNPHLRRLDPMERRLSFMFTGYLDVDVSRLLVGAMVTNFQDFSSGTDDSQAWDEFRPLFLREKRPAPEPVPTYVQRIGMWPAMVHDDIESLRSMLAERRPAQAIVEKALSVVRTVAARSEAGGTVGTDLSCVSLFSDTTRPPVVGYHPAAVAHEWHGISDVVAVHDDLRFSLKDLVIRATDPGSDTPPLAGPKVGRNKPCPCGSGTKYKRCCGSRR